MEIALSGTLYCGGRAELGERRSYFEDPWLEDETLLARLETGLGQYWGKVL